MISNGISFNYIVIDLVEHYSFNIGHVPFEIVWNFRKFESQNLIT
jgi:hypothetical protein